MAAAVSTSSYHARSPDQDFPNDFPSVVLSVQGVLIKCVYHWESVASFVDEPSIAALAFVAAIPWISSALPLGWL
jgi:hypothetical protein